MIREIIKNKYFNLALLTIIVFILSFPRIEPDISTGLDASYFYAINHFFAHNINIAKDLIFTYGPLGFLKQPQPVGHNLGIGISVIVFLRLIFISLFLFYSYSKKQKYLLPFFIALLLTGFISFDHFIYGIIILLLLIYRDNKHTGFIIGAVFLVVLGLLIKINIGIISGIIFCSFLVCEVIRTKNYKIIIYSAASFLACFIILWYLIYGNMSGIISYLKGLFIFSLGNSGAFSINPRNNWFILILAFLIFILIPFLKKDRNVVFLYILFVPAFFAIFKYAFARQENYHIKYFLDYLVLFIALFLVAINDIKPYILAMLFMVLILFYRNTGINKTYTIDDKIQLVGINNFAESFWYFSDFKTKYKKISENNLREKVLPEEFLKTIKNSTVDFFPWELTYAAANKLNYKPRPTLQSGCLYAPPSIDKRNADHISSGEAAKFFIWETNRHEGALNGFDKRYILNSDGLFLYEFLNNYKIVLQNDNVALLQRTGEHLLDPPKLIGCEKAKFWEWIKVPEVKNGIVRARASISRSFLGKIKSILYKEKEYFIEYKLENGEIITHRFSLDNTKGGLWISPYITEVKEILDGAKVTEIRFYYSDNSMFMKDDFDIEWEHITYITDTEKNDDRPGKDNDSGMFYNDFEEYYPYWTTDSLQFSTDIYLSGSRSYKTNSEYPYSATLSINYKDIGNFDTCRFVISVNVFIKEGALADLVFHTTRNEKTQVWEPLHLHDTIAQFNTWQEISFTYNNNNNILPDDLVKVYVWNNGQEEVYIDDFRIEVINKE